MRSSERVYALLVQANPVPDPQAVPPEPSSALLTERRSVMLTQEPTETKQAAQRPRWPRAVVAFAATIVIVAAAVGIWALADNGGPVAAGDAQIEVTFTGDEANYTGHSEIYPGRADVVFTNDSDAPAWIVVHRFETGSAELAAELARAPLGSDFVTTESPPGVVRLMEEILPASESSSGTVTRSITLAPGSTYLLNVAVSGEETIHVWQTALFEVVVAD